MAGLLILLQVVMYFITFIVLFRKDKFLAAFYGALYLYLLPTIIGYYYFPSFTGYALYFGEVVWLEFYLFSTLSLASFWLCSLFLVQYGRQSSWIYVNCSRPQKHKPRVSLAGYVLFVAYTILEVILFVRNYSNISYVRLASPSYLIEHPELWILNLMFKTSVYLNLIISAVLISGKTRRKGLLTLLLSVNIALFCVFAFKGGNRSAIISLVLGIVVFVVTTKRLNYKRVIRMIVVFGVSGIFMLSIASNRRGYSLDSVPLIRKILVQDYYWPAHNILAVMYHNFINPLELVKSNLINTAVLMDYPYITETVGQLLATNVDSANGIGFHIFTEGYIFCGIWGFLYNGIVITFLINIWKNMVCSNDREFNGIMIAICSSQFINIVRAPSLWFVKNIYLYFFPAAILYALLTQKRIRLVIPRRHKRRTDIAHKV